MSSQYTLIDPADLWDKDIFELLGLENAPEEKKKEILENMTATINNRILARVMDQLDETELTEYEELLDQKDDEKIIGFLKNKGIDLVQYAAEESMIYKTEMLNLAQKDDTGTKE
jgi:hypothetical protein